MAYGTARPSRDQESSRFAASDFTRDRFLAVAKDKEAAAVTAIVEADETFILKSAKGSRNLVGWAPRKRGGKAKKPGLSIDEHDAILIVRDRHGETTDAILADLSAETIGARLKPVVAKDAVLVTSQGERTVGCYHIQNVNAYQSRFKSWMVRFKGVASKYLPSYLGWRRIIERDGDRLTPRQCLASAIG